MARVDELITDLELLIKEHYELEKVIEEIARLKEAVKDTTSRVSDSIEKAYKRDI